jgi:CheY-like chemotaxis protein
MEAQATHRPLVMIVEDDAAIREALEEIVTMRGFGAVGASNGAEALELLAAHRPQLILLDLMMPVMNGWEFLAALRRSQELSTIPVVVLSAFGSALAIRSAGADDFVSKPFDISALLGVIRRYCEPPAPR